MDYSKTLISLVCVAFLTSAFPKHISAQPWEGYYVPTFREKRDSADALVVGKVIYTKSANLDRNFPGRSVVVIRRIEKDRSKKLVSEELAIFPYDLKLQPGQLLHLPGTVTEHGVEWGISEQVSSAAFQYLAEAPKSDASVQQRLSYFVKFLTHTDPLIAADASKEFQISPFVEVRKIRDLLDRADLRSLIENSESNIQLVAQRGTYCRLLGLCGNHSDAKYLESCILKEPVDFRIGIEWAMVAYLHLTGEEGLSVLDEHKLRNHQDLFSETFAAFEALRFMWKHGEDRISEVQLKQSMRILLERPNLADLVIVDLVIVDLARWEDWRAMDQIVKLYDEKEYDIARIKRAIIRYLITAKKSVKETPDAKKPPQVIKAENYLQQFRESDPKTVKSAERYFFD